jgi:hypothetical protein
MRESSFAIAWRTLDSDPVKRNWLVASIVVGILVIVGAAIVARLADDDFTSVDTTEWAGSVCTSLSEWRSAITGLADVDEGELTAESLEGKLDEAGDATEELVDDLKRLGPPDLEARDDVEQALDDAAEGLEESFDSLRSDAQAALEADSATEFLQELTALAPQFQALLQQVQDTVASLQSASLFGESSAELEQAFADADSCQQLRAEG